MSEQHAGLDPAWGPCTEDRLTRDLTIVQRLKGHRFSSDDMATAFTAVERAPAAARVLDLGCGIGSVLLHLAWSIPSARLVGIEAQEISFAILRENVRRNRLGDRVAIHHGDLRDARDLGGPFDLITGTPPYFPPDTAVSAGDAQRAFARIEFRGGIEAYVAAGERELAADGSLVLCGDARAEARLRSAAVDAQLFVVATTRIVAHAPKPPLFSVWTLSRSEEAPVESELVLRDALGNTTADAARLKAFSGFDR